MRYANQMTILAILSWMFFTSAAAVQIEKDIWSVYYSLEGDWAESNDLLQEVLEDRGLVVTYTSYASEFLNRTLEVSGVEKTVYKHARIHLFCKVGLSHELTSKNPHAISSCPYGISVYELKEKQGTIYFGYQRGNPPEVNELLDDIIREVVEY